MNPEEERYIRKTVDQWMNDSGYKPNSEPFIGYPQSRVIELEQRLKLANETIRNANQRIEELKSVRISNPNFGIFGLDPNTAFINLSEEEIQMVLKSTYRLRAKLNHPDSGGKTVSMKEVNISYQKLKDPITRGKYKK